MEKVLDSTGKLIKAGDVLTHEDSQSGLIRVVVFNAGWNKDSYVVFPDGSSSKLSDFEDGYWSIMNKKGEIKVVKEAPVKDSTETYALLNKLNVEQSELRVKFYKLSQFLETHKHTAYGQEYDETLKSQKTAMQAYLGFLSQRINILEESI